MKKSLLTFAGATIAVLSLVGKARSNTLLHCCNASQDRNIGSVECSSDQPSASRNALEECAVSASGSDDCQVTGCWLSATSTAGAHCSDLKLYEKEIEEISYSQCETDRLGNRTCCPHLADVYLNRRVLEEQEKCTNLFHACTGSQGFGRLELSNSTSGDRGNQPGCFAKVHVGCFR